MKFSNAIYGFKWNEIETKTVVGFSFYMTEWLYLIKWSFKKMSSRCVKSWEVTNWFYLGLVIYLNQNQENNLKIFNTTVKLLDVNIMDLWANPLEIHITLFAFCLIEIIFEFYPQSDIIELYCPGILKLTKITLGLSKSDLNKIAIHTIEVDVFFWIQGNQRHLNSGSYVEFLLRICHMW